MKRLATTSTVVARKPHDSKAVNAVHKRESQLCALNPEGEVTEARSCGRRGHTSGSGAAAVSRRSRTTAHDLPIGTLRAIERDLEPILGASWLRDMQ